VHDLHIAVDANQPFIETRHSFPIVPHAQTSGHPLKYILCWKLKSGMAHIVLRVRYFSIFCK
jgi:hypothetical protein